jgi:hypothetical protein
MTPLADMIPAMNDADLKSLRVNAERLSATGSLNQVSAATEILPLIDAETARRAALPSAVAPKKTRAPARKKVVAASGHQTALPSRAA